MDTVLINSAIYHYYYHRYRRSIVHYAFRSLMSLIMSPDVLQINHYENVKSNDIIVIAVFVRSIKNLIQLFIPTNYYYYYKPCRLFIFMVYAVDEGRYLKSSVL